MTQCQCVHSADSHSADADGCGNMTDGWCACTYVPNTKGTDTVNATNDQPATLADLLAAVEIGAMDPNTAVVPTASIATQVRAAHDAGRKAGYEVGLSDAMAGLGQTPTPSAPAPALLNGVPVHDCAVSGCAHGATHGPDYVPQPDRQTVLQAPCGSRVRVTNRALALAGGALYCGHGDTYAVAARRAYTPRAR